MSTSAAARSSSGLISLFKQGWNEIPEVVGSSAVALVGLVIGAAGVANYYARDGDNRRFKSTIVIFRPEDPRAALVRKD